MQFFYEEILSNGIDMEVILSFVGKTPGSGVEGMDTPSTRTKRKRRRKKGLDKKGQVLMLVSVVHLTVPFFLWPRQIVILPEVLPKWPPRFGLQKIQEPLTYN